VEIVGFCDLAKFVSRPCAHRFFSSIMLIFKPDFSSA